MFKEKLNDLKEMITAKTKGNNKRNIENLVVFLVLLIVTIIAINVIWGENKTNAEENNEETDSYKTLAKESNSNILKNNEYNLEKKLEDILSNITGVGKVKVMITYSRNK